MAFGRSISWTVAEDHYETDPLTGDPIVAAYELIVYDFDTRELVGTENVGKPTPDGNDVITITTSTLLNGLTSGVYLIQVASLGPNWEVSPDQIGLSHEEVYTI